MPAGKGEAWVIWGLLTAGASLAFFSLFRNFGRFREWRNLRAEQEGEIVFSERALRVGQAVQVEDASNGGAKYSATLCALEKRTMRLRLERPAAETGKEPPRRGAVLRLAVTGQDAVFRLQTQVLDAVPCAANVPVRGEALLTLKRPFWLSRIQRRNHVRIAFALPAAFEFANPVNLLTERTAQHGVIVDLSGGGLCADVGGPCRLRDAAELLALLRPDTILRVRLPIPALTDPLLVRIRLSRRTAVRGGLGVRVACEFLPMPPWEQDLIVHYIFRHQREQKRTGKEEQKAAAKTSTEAEK